MTAAVTPIRYRDRSGSSPPDRLGEKSSSTIPGLGPDRRDGRTTTVGRARRVNVTVQKDLDEQVRERFGDVAYSALLQQAMRDLLVCPHPALQCTACGDPVEPAAVAGARLDRFFRDLTGALDEYVQRGGSVTGFGRVVRRLGLEHLIPLAAGWAPPRLSRSQLQERGIGKTGEADGWRESA